MLALCLRAFLLFYPIPTITIPPSFVFVVVASMVAFVVSCCISLLLFCYHHQRCILFFWHPRHPCHCCFVVLPIAIVVFIYALPTAPLPLLLSVLYFGVRCILLLFFFKSFLPPSPTFCCFCVSFATISTVVFGCFFATIAIVVLCCVFSMFALFIGVLRLLFLVVFST